MTYRQKFYTTLALTVPAYFLIPHPAKAVATLFMGMLCGHFLAKSETYD